jgi:hypothetical protein
MAFQEEAERDLQNAIKQGVIMAKMFEHYFPPLRDPIPKLEDTDEEHTENLGQA